MTVLCQSFRSAGRAFTLRQSQFRTKKEYTFASLAARASLRTLAGKCGASGSYQSRIDNGASQKSQSGSFGRMTRHSYNGPAPSSAHMPGVLTCAGRALSTIYRPISARFPGTLKIVFGGVPMGLLSHGELQNASVALTAASFAHASGSPPSKSFRRKENVAL